MSEYSKIALRLSAFLILVGVVYGIVSREFVGTPLILIAAGSSAYIGLFVRRSVRATAAEPATDAGGEGDVEPHVGPTIWPFVFSLAAVGFVLGAVVSPWLLVLGAVPAAAAAAGWFRDIGRQWEGGSGHGHEPSKTTQPTKPTQPSPPIADPAEPLSSARRAAGGLRYAPRWVTSGERSCSSPRGRSGRRTTASASQASFASAGTG